MIHMVSHKGLVTKLDPEPTWAGPHSLFFPLEGNHSHIHKIQTKLVIPSQVFFFLTIHNLYKPPHCPLFPFFLLSLSFFFFFGSKAEL